MTNRGSALLIVVISLFLITILISTLLMFNYYQNLLIIKEINKTKSFYLAESGLQYSLAMLADRGYDAVGKNFGEEISSKEMFNTSIIPFGGYLLCEAQGRSGKEETILHGLIAGREPDCFRRSINIKDPNYPLMISGKTEIIGDVAVSNAGVITGRFKGKGFEGKVPIQGKILDSAVEILPEHDLKAFYLFNDSLNNLRKSLDEFSDRTAVFNDENIERLTARKAISFGSDVYIDIRTKICDLTNKYIRVKGNLYVKGASRIRGFGIIDVQKSIEISGDSEIRDCVLISTDSTIIKGNCILSNQVIAGYKISVNDNAKTEAPCLLLIYDPGGNKGEIDLNSRSVCGGNAVLLTGYSDEMKWGKNEEPPRIKISENSTFDGLIYSNMYVSNFGTVEGNITTKSFYFYEQPTVYLNWLVDARIVNDQENNASGIPMLFNTTKSELKYDYYY